MSDFKTKKNSEGEKKRQIVQRNKEISWREKTIGEGKRGGVGSLVLTLWRTLIRERKTEYKIEIHVYILEQF